MPHNIEIKARAQNFERQLQHARRLGGEAQRLVQRDTFFKVPQGRLKLRVQEAGRGQLIYYERADAAGPKVSHYQLTPTDDPEGLEQLLGAALGVLGTVHKTRLVYLVGQTRIHLDEVQGLGHYLELEVVLRPGQPPEQGEAEARRLMTELEVEPQDLVQGAYFDLVKRCCVEEMKQDETSKQDGSTT